MSDDQFELWEEPAEETDHDDRLIYDEQLPIAELEQDLLSDREELAEADGRDDWTTGVGDVSFSGGEYISLSIPGQFDFDPYNPEIPVDPTSEFWENLTDYQDDGDTSEWFDD